MKPWDNSTHFSILSAALEECLLCVSVAGAISASGVRV